MKRVILTGADGFIGRQAIAPLIQMGYEIHAVSNIDPVEELRIENVNWHRTDLLDPLQTSNLCSRINATHLLHFSWYVEHGKFWDSDKNRDWVAASLLLLKSFKTHGGKRVVMAGTCAEYELEVEDTLHEFESACKPNTLYGRSKLELMRELENCGIDWSWGRIFFLYGPYEAKSRLVASVINSLLEGETAKCSQGYQIRDFMHVADVADAFVALLDSRVKGPVNIASGVPVTIREVVNRIAALVDLRAAVEFGAIDSTGNEPKSIVADVARLRDEVKWTQSMDLDQGLKETVTWWQERKSLNRDAESGK